MAAERWNYEDHRMVMRAIGTAAIQEVTGNCADLAQFRSDLMTLAVRIADAVGRYAVDFANGNGPFEAEDESEGTSEMGHSPEPKPVEFTIFGPIDFVAVA